MWPVTLSGRLLIVALVGRYLTNKLIRRGSISYHRSFSHCIMRCCALMRFYQPFPAAIPLYEAGYPRVTHPSATQSLELPSEEFHSSASFDLHVLSTPPAFILSQDQTLIKYVLLHKTLKSYFVTPRCFSKHQVCLVSLKLTSFNSFLILCLRIHSIA